MGRPLQIQGMGNQSECKTDWKIRKLGELGGGKWSEKRQKAHTAGALVSLVCSLGTGCFVPNELVVESASDRVALSLLRLIPHTPDPLRSDETTPTSSNRLQITPSFSLYPFCLHSCPSPRTPFFLDCLLSNPGCSLTSHRRCHYCEVVPDPSLTTSACTVTASALISR